jgi:hypothetical protein
MVAPYICSHDPPYVNAYAFVAADRATQRTRRIRRTSMDAAGPVALRRPAFVCFCGACIHLVASAALVAVAYRSFGGQGAAWALGAVFLSCLAVPFLLPRRAPRIAAPGAGVVAAPGPDAAASGAGGGPAGDGRMELPAAFKFKRDVRAARAGWSSPVHVTICCGLWPSGNKTCLFLTKPTTKKTGKARPIYSGARPCPNPGG